MSEFAQNNPLSSFFLLLFVISGMDAKGNASQRFFLKCYFSVYLNLVTQLPQTSLPVEQ